MPFNTKTQRQSTRTITVKWETDQGRHDCTITYRLGVLGTFSDQELEKMNSEDWFEQVVTAWDVTDADDKPLPPTKDGFALAREQGNPIPPWFTQLLTDAIYNDARPPTLTSRDSGDL